MAHLLSVKITGSLSDPQASITALVVVLSESESWKCLSLALDLQAKILRNELPQPPAPVLQEKV